MTIDLERDLRREFDGATLPSALTFHPESIVRQGRQTIRRRRNLVGGSAALAIALVAGGAAVLNRPHDVVAPQPTIPTATSTATSSTTSSTTSGIIRTELGSFDFGKLEIELNRDPKVTSNVKLLVVKEGEPRREVGTWSTGKPGQKPDATWKSGMVDGHPFTVGLIPGTPEDIEYADHGFYGWAPTKVEGTIYTALAVDYTQRVGNDPNAIPKEAARPVRITSISWSGPTGIVDGIEGGHRLAGQIFPIDKLVSVKVVLRPGKGGRTVVSGTVRLKGGSTSLNDSTTNDSGAAVVIGSYLILRPVSQGTELVGGAPIAAGILPAGAQDIGVILTTGEVAVGRPVSDRLADGRVIFAIKAESALPSEPNKDSIKTVTWTNANGSQGRMNVPRQQR